ncbi:MAG: hypothetical protein J07HQX50_01686 [Haloquadratum sp. J07HQX50]|nr:MAG: hypothetical protein J07HQX50_01686 [Haloquadratum sp. J07HQX50]
MTGTHLLLRDGTQYTFTIIQHAIRTGSESPEHTETQ